MSWCDEPPPLLLLEAIAQFNRGDYFEQHETLELLWRAEARPVRRLYQGILQIGVAFHHLRRRNYHGVVYMLTRGAAYLKPFAPRCQGVDVGALLDAVALALRTVEALGPTRLHEFDWRLAPQVVPRQYRVLAKIVDVRAAAGQFYRRCVTSCGRSLRAGRRCPLVETSCSRILLCATSCAYSLVRIDASPI